MILKVNLHFIHIFYRHNFHPLYHLFGVNLPSSHFSYFDRSVSSSITLECYPNVNSGSCHHDLFVYIYAWLRPVRCNAGARLFPGSVIKARYHHYTPISNDTYEDFPHYKQNVGCIASINENVHQGSRYLFLVKY